MCFPCQWITQSQLVASGGRLDAWARASNSRTLVHTITFKNITSIKELLRKIIAQNSQTKLLIMYHIEYNTVSVITTLNLSQSNCLIICNMQHRGWGRMCVGIHIFLWERPYQQVSRVFPLCMLKKTVILYFPLPLIQQIFLYYRTESCSIHSTPSCLLCLSALNLHPLTLRAKEPSVRSEVSSSALPSSFTPFCPHN